MSLMRKAARAVIIYLVLTLLISMFSTAFAATPQEWNSEHPEDLETGHLFAEASILVDQETGEVLFSKNADARMYPASTTKILTLLLALESGIPMDSIVTIPPEADETPEDGSFVPVYAGEKWKFLDLLYGFMLNSGNDGAVAVAMHVAGTEERFVEMMNQKAAQLGCVSTHFANCHGYHDDNHYTTASDMALIARAAMENAQFREIVATVEHHITDKSGNSNPKIKTRVDLINPESKYYYEYCTGIKTGFHSRAGQCLVASAKMGDRTVIAVVLHSTRDYVERKWYDAARMFVYGFTRYDQYSISQLYDMADDSISNIQVENAAENDPYSGNLSLILSQTNNDGYTIMTLKDTNELADSVAYFNANTTVTLSTDYLNRLETRETIEAGSIVGTLDYKTTDGDIITGTLIASRSVEFKPFEVNIWQYLTENIPALRYVEDQRVIYGFIITVVLFIIIIIVATSRSRRRARRRKRIYEQRRRAYMQQQRQAAARAPQRPAQRRAPQKRTNTRRR